MEKKEEKLKEETKQGTPKKAGRWIESGGIMFRVKYVVTKDKSIEIPGTYKRGQTRLVYAKTKNDLYKFAERRLYVAMIMDADKRNANNDWEPMPDEKFFDIPEFTE